VAGSQQLYFLRVHALLGSDSMVAADSEAAPSFWSELLLGILGGGCRVQKTSFPGCSEVVNVVDVGVSGKRRGAPVPPEILSEPEAESSPLGHLEAATREAARSSECSDEVPDGVEQQLAAVKVFAGPPSQGHGDNLGRQCCQKLCPVPGCAEPVTPPSPGRGESLHFSNQVKRGPNGVRFCVLMRDGSGLLSSESHQEAGALLPSFRECFSEAAAKAAGVSVTRVRVLEVGLPRREAWARPNKAESEASGTPSGSTDTGAGVLRFLLDEDQPGESKAMEEEPEAEDKALEAPRSYLRILAVIRDQEELDERSGSTVDSSSVEEPGAMRALENFMEQVSDRGSKLHQSLAGWAGDEPLLACGEGRLSPQGKPGIPGRRWASRRDRTHRPRGARSDRS